MKYIVLLLCFLLLKVGELGAFEADVDPSGCLLERVAVEAGQNSYQYGSLSPDGQYIFYSSDDGNEVGKTNVHVMTRNGRHVAQLTAHTEKDAYAFSSIDGSELYFMSYREDQGVYRMMLRGDMTCLENKMEI